MGSYLSTPITEKHTDTGVHLHSDIKLTYCVSEMQVCYTTNLPLVSFCTILRVPLYFSHVHVFMC